VAQYELRRNLPGPEPEADAVPKNALRDDSRSVFLADLQTSSAAGCFPGPQEPEHVRERL